MLVMLFYTMLIKLGYKKVSVQKYRFKYLLVREHSFFVFYKILCDSLFWNIKDSLNPTTVHLKLSLSVNKKSSVNSDFVFSEIVLLGENLS